MLSSGTQGLSYSSVLLASGGTAPYTWTISSGGLSSGLSLGIGTGIISGIPTASGNFSIGVTVKDSSAAAQTANATLALSIAAATAQLAITSSTLPGATSNESYNASLSATGGKAPYTWSITSGSLPSGLNLATGTGVISGTTTASGTASFTVEVRDSESSTQTVSAKISLSVTAAPLTITSSTPPSGTDGTAYSSSLQASGGEPAYTWSISSGSLPSGLTLAATTGVISGTPSASGTSKFTATVSDNSNPVETKSVAISIVVAAQQQTGSGKIWYIRLDGGTAAQCSGTTNAPYPGSGTGLACAVNHPFWLLNQSTFAWNITGGDTIQFEDEGPYYIGQALNGLGFSWSYCVGNEQNCVAPALPSGTSESPTRVLGLNTGNCHNSGHTGLVNPTVLSAVNGAFEVFNLQGTAYPDLECIEITQPDTCTNSGSMGGECAQGKNNYGQHGIRFEYQVAQGPSNATLRDIEVVGMASQGLLGSHINTLNTDVFTASDIYILGNGAAGWDSDGGNCETNCESVGTMNLSYVDVEWNGCVAVMPYNNALPASGNSFNYCYDQSTGGYGDGFSFIAAGNVTLNVSHSFFRYNTQDGFDSLHLSDDVTTSPSVNVSDSWSEGNEGQTFKLGAGTEATAINNVSISNCRVLTIASNFPNNPAGWNAGVSDVCRAAGDEWAFQLNSGTVVTLENNTSVGYGTTMYDVGCAPLAPNCMSDDAHFIFKNNISKGYPDPGNGGRVAAGFYFGAGNVFANAGSVISSNLWSTMDTSCPDSSISGSYEKIYTCADPLLVGESNINAINPRLTSSSPAIGAGVATPTVTTDYSGVTRPNPPSIGAFEP
jgi:Putative Ig domain